MLQVDNENNMKMREKILRTFIKYVSLNILGMIGISCYILADTFFVSKALGATGLAALNFAISIYSVIHGIGLMIGIGGGARYSILKSQKKEDKAEEVFCVSVKFGLLAGVFLMIIGLTGSEYIGALLGADSITLPLTKVYLMTILLFSPAFITNNVMLSFVRNNGNPRLSMTAMILGSLSNIILDYVFIFIFGWGMFGAAFATGIAPIVSIGILMLHFKDKGSFAFLRRKMKMKIVPDILRLGASAFVTEVSSAVVLITFNLIILGLEGNAGVAAYGIVANVALVGISVFTGLSQGIQPLTSRYYGLREGESLKKVRTYAICTAMIMAAAIYLFIFFNAGLVAEIFNSEGNIRIAAMAQTGLKLYFIGFFFAGLNIVMAMYLSATEKAGRAFLISITRGLIVIIPAVLIMSRLLDMTGVWLSFVVTEGIVSLISISELIKSQLPYQATYK